MDEQSSLASQFQSDGVVPLHGIFRQRVLELEAAIKHAQEHPSPMASAIQDESGNVTFFTDFFTYKKNPIIDTLVRDRELVETVKKVVHSRELRLFHDHILVKRGEAPETPWHQDRPYYLVDGPISCSVWITPDYVPLEESLNFIRGSHRTGLEYSPVAFKDGQIISSESSFRELDDQEIARLSRNGVLSFSLEPGDALLFDNRVLHKASRGLQPASRRALSIRYVGDGAFLTERFVNATPPFNRMGLRVSEGATLPDVWFPKVSEVS